MLRKKLLSLQIFIHAYVLRKEDVLMKAWGTKMFVWSINCDTKQKQCTQDWHARQQFNSVYGPYFPSHCAVCSPWVVCNRMSIILSLFPSCLSSCGKNCRKERQKCWECCRTEQEDSLCIVKGLFRSISPANSRQGRRNPIASLSSDLL